MVLDLFPLLQRRNSLPKKKVKSVEILTQELETEISARCPPNPASPQKGTSPDYSWLATCQTGYTAHRLSVAQVVFLEQLCSTLMLSDTAPIVHQFRASRPEEEEEDTERTFARMVQVIRSYCEDKERIILLRSRPASARQRLDKVSRVIRPLLSAKMGSRVGPSACTTSPPNSSTSTSIFTIASVVSMALE